MRLLMIPAFACDADLYGAVAEMLRPDFDCTIVAADEPTIEASATRILAEAGDAPFLVWGTSLGGHVAREIAILAPDRLAGLVISGAGVGAPAARSIHDARRDAITEDGGAVALEDMARRIVFEPEGRGRAAADAFRAMSRAASREKLLAQNEALATRPDRTDRLHAIAARTLLLWGGADSFSPVEAAPAIAEAMPDAELVVLEDCGHLPSLEAPMRCVAEIRRVFVGNEA